MNPNALLSEDVGVLATLDPVSQGAGTITTGWINAGNFLKFMALIQTGVLGAAATVDAKLQQATDAAGTGVKDIAGKAIVQIVKATGDNKQAEINLRPEQLDVNNGFGFVRLSLTVGTAASLVGASVLGAFPRQGTGGDKNQAAVVQTIQ
jgi:hypothetical protein